MMMPIRPALEIPMACAAAAKPLPMLVSVVFVRAGKVGVVVGPVPVAETPVVVLGTKAYEVMSTAMTFSGL